MARVLAARGGDRPLFLLAVVLALSYLVVIYFEPINEGGTPVESSSLMERYASVSVPNYKKVWWARSLLWINADFRGGYPNSFTLDLFGMETLVKLGAYPSGRHAPNWTIPIDEAVRQWERICPLDSDADTFTNGQELGDPCCIWKPGMAAAWSFHISHPGYRVNNHKMLHRTLPNSEAQAFIQRTDCTEVRKAGRYEPSDRDFVAWYYQEHFEYVEYGSKTFVRILILIAHAFLVIFWILEKQLWRDILPASFKCHRRISFPRLCAVAVCSYLFVDLASAFVHAFLDNCHSGGPIVGSLCKAFQHHHHHPRSLSVAPVLYWVTHTLEGALPVTFVYVVLGVYYKLPKEAELFVGFTSVLWPLTYVWHNMAHLPESHRMSWFRALQSMGLALSSERHFVHHRLIDQSWSSMAGIMDFVPNMFVRVFYDRQNAIATWSILFSMLFGPWFGFFTNHVLLRRGRAATAAVHSD